MSIATAAFRVLDKVEKALTTRRASAYEVDDVNGVQICHDPEMPATSGDRISP